MPDAPRGPRDEGEDDPPPPSNRVTAPPSPSYPMLRDSCRSELVAEPLVLDDDTPVGSLSEPFEGEDVVPVLVVGERELELVALDASMRALVDVMNGVASLSQLARWCRLPLPVASQAVRRLVKKGVVRLKTA